MSATMERVDDLELAPLSTAEREELQGLEEVIQEGRERFIAVGAALITISEKRLYRETHPTFEVYLRERWEISRPRGYEFMRAAEVVQQLAATSEVTPANEGVARAIGRVPDEERSEVWQEAVETAPTGRPTAAHVESVYEARHPELVKPAPAPAAEPVSEQQMLPDVPRPAAFDYRGWEIGNPTEWTDQSTGDVRQGVVNNLWNGSVVVLPADGKPPKGGLPLNPELLRRPAQPTHAEPSAPEQDAESQPAIPSVAEVITAPAAAPAAPETPAPKPTALRSAEEIVQANAGKAVETTIGATPLDAPVTMCMVAQDCVSWLASDSLNVKTFLLRLKSAAYQRGQSAAELLAGLEAS